MPEMLTGGERKMLLELARQALVDGVSGRPLPPLELSALPEILSQPGATFVTLTHQGELRGCVGALEAYQPLAEDVREHAIAAALQDFRFPPVTADEAPRLEIEISWLSTPMPLEYCDAQDLMDHLRPGIDGVLLRDGLRRATFLPQVWEKLPDPAQFLEHLCMKMGLEANAWRVRNLKVYTYQVEEFCEGG